MLKFGVDVDVDTPEPRLQFESSAAYYERSIARLKAVTAKPQVRSRLCFTRITSNTTGIRHKTIGTRCSILSSDAGSFRTRFPTAQAG